MKAPKLYKKKDGAYYFTFKGRQHYAGRTLEKAEVKLREVTALEPDGETCLVTLVGRYLDSLVGSQSADTIYGKAVAYKSLLAHLGHTPLNGKSGPSLRSLHEDSGAPDKHDSYAEAFSGIFPDSVTLDALSAQNLAKYQQTLLKTVKKTSVRSTIVKIQALCKWLYDNRYTTTNSCARLNKVKVVEELNPDCLTEEEVEKLFDLVGKGTPYSRVRDRLLFGLTIYAGLRRIECTRIKWTDIDFEKRVLVVRNGKGGKNRLIAINDRLHEILTTLEHYGKHVLSTRKGKQVSRAALGKVTNKYVDKLNHQYKGKTRFSLHSLRATFATRLCEKGVSTRIVQDLLGHSDPKTTLRYAAVSQAAALDAVQRL